MRNELGKLTYCSLYHYIAFRFLLLFASLHPLFYTYIYIFIHIYLQQQQQNILLKNAFFANIFRFVLFTVNNRQTYVCVFLFFPNNLFSDINLFLLFLIYMKQTFLYTFKLHYLFGHLSIYEFFFLFESPSKS